MKLMDKIYYYPEQGMMDCNTYIIKDDLILLIDVGLGKNLDSLIREMEKDGILPDEIDVISNTHLHMDHAWANQEFKDKYRAKIEIAPVQKKYYDVGVRQTSLFFNIEPVEFTEDSLLKSKIELGNLEVEIIETPGHSPDSVCFYCLQNKCLICGDLVFQYNTGRPDLPGGDINQLKASVEKIAELDIEYLLPGHMEIITGRKNVKKNFEFIKHSFF